MTKPLVLVTGGSGFIALHVILQLLQSDYRVRVTLRTLTREQQLRDALIAAGIGADVSTSSLSFVAADLTHDAGWDAAVAGCTYVMHVASPFPSAAPRNEDDLIVPAREGTLRVLRAAKAAGVKRVVVTSSFAAIGYGSVDKPGHVYTEADWTPVDDMTVPAYQRSKTLAERAAWDFISEECGGKKEGGGGGEMEMELSVVCPVAVMGPIIDKEARLSTSTELVKRMLSGGMPAVPRLQLGIVDVRDVAQVHLKAMLEPQAADQRYLCVAGQQMWLREIAGVLKERLGEKARSVSQMQAPSFLLKLAAYVSATARLVGSELDREKVVCGGKATALLGREFITREDSIVATAESLFELGML